MHLILAGITALSISSGAPPEMKIDEEQSFDIDLGEWNVCQQAGIALAQELDRVMLPLMFEILQDMFRNYPPLLDLHLPWETADRSELAIRLDLPLQNPGDYGVSYTCSLEFPLSTISSRPGSRRTRMMMAKSASG